MGFDLGLVSLVGLGLVISGSVSQGLVSWVGRQVSELGCQLVGWVGVQLVSWLVGSLWLVGWGLVSSLVSLGLVQGQLLISQLGQLVSLGLVQVQFRVWCQGLGLGGSGIGFRQFIRLVQGWPPPLVIITQAVWMGQVGVGYIDRQSQVSLGPLPPLIIQETQPIQYNHPANLSKLTLTNQPTIPCEPPLQGRPSQGGVTSSPWSYFGATNVLGKLDMSNSWLKCLKTEISTLFLEYLPK